MVVGECMCSEVWGGGRGEEGVCPLSMRSRCSIQDNLASVHCCMRLTAQFLRASNAKEPMLPCGPQLLLVGGTVA